MLKSICFLKLEYLGSRCALLVKPWGSLIYQRGSIMAPHGVGVTLKSSQTPTQLHSSVSPPLSLLLTTVGTRSTQSTQLTGVSKYPDLGPSKLLILPSSHLLVTSQKRAGDCFEGSLARRAGLERADQEVCFQWCLLPARRDAKKWFNIVLDIFRGCDRVWIIFHVEGEIK